SDIDSVPWAQEAITELKRIGVINGVSDTQFAPNRNVTREEFAKMIVSAFSVSGTGAAFADVPSTAWYAPYVTALASSGIVNGVSDSEFGVGTNISRQDAAVMLDRTAQHVGIEYEFDTSALHIFTDYMADYARISIYRLYQIGVVNGTSATTFSATETLTRAQAAKMIYGLMQLK
ncbi:MAG: S-layer homology domain-containing protein, partial [Clostridia bacterium]|nr:S-layer homology domain-containing protein [Clostridia bacterium]